MTAAGRPSTRTDRPQHVLGDDKWCNPAVSVRCGVAALQHATTRIQLPHPAKVQFGSIQRWELPFTVTCRSSCSRYSRRSPLRKQQQQQQLQLHTEQQTMRSPILPMTGPLKSATSLACEVQARRINSDKPLILQRVSPAGYVYYNQAHNQQTPMQQLPLHPMRCSMQLLASMWIQNSTVAAGCAPAACNLGHRLKSWSAVLSTPTVTHIR